jgi:hypothetical protein
MDTNRHEFQQKPRITRISRIGWHPKAFGDFPPITNDRLLITSQYGIRVIRIIRGFLFLPLLVFIRVHSWFVSEKIVRILLAAGGANQIQARECAAGQGRNREYAKVKRADRDRFCRSINTYENNTSGLWKH